MTKGTVLRIIGALVGLVAVALLIIFALPLVAFGDHRPFDSALVRGIIVAVTSLCVLGYLVYDVYQRSKQAKELAAGMAAPGEEAKDGDGQVLQEKMNDALSTLKKASTAKGDFLYDLPWYIIIGPPGAGKTTALINSGLKFPLAKGASPQAIAGVGGTRYCDWWFTEDAVLIDTAGRYTTQDSDASVDKKSWLSFLNILKRSRPKQPINGVLVCISVEDVLSLPQEEVYAHADAIRTRLIELHQQLKVDFPVYAVFTKADLIAGFMEFFGHLTEEGRRAVWGATFQTDDKTANMIGEVPGEFDRLIERLNQELVDRLQEEPNPTARVQVFGFPSQVAALKKPVHDFLTRIFEPTRYHSNATLRGFYFTSGTQEGTPIDQLIGALSRSFGAQDAGPQQYSGLGKSFFLTHLLDQVVFAEAGWVSTNRSAVRRATLLKAAAYVFLFLGSAAAVAGWWISYGRNSDLIAKTYESVTRYKTIAAPVRDETVINDRDFARVLPALHHLRNMPAGYGLRDEHVPIQATLGLNQWPRINVSAETAYEMALQRLFRPRLMYRLEERMRDNLTNPGFLTEALKVYLMVAGIEPADKERVIQWWRADWSENLFRGAGNAPGRQALEDHLTRLLELDPPEGYAALDIDRPLVQEAQAAIGRMSVADRAFEILRSGSRANSARDWVMRRKAGQDAALVFEGAGGVDLDNVKVPFFYTYAGFQEDFLAKIQTVADRVAQERKLLGDVAAQQAVQAQYDNLAPALMDRYQKEFIAAWRQALNQLRIKLLTADKPRYVALQAAAAATSPIAQLIESIRDETQLTKEKPAQPPAPGAAPAPAPVAPKFMTAGGDPPGAAVEAAFRPYQQLAEGARGQRGLDELLRGLNDIYSSLVMLNDPTRATEGQVKFRDSIRNLQATATRFPDPFKAMIQTSVGAFDTDATGTTVARLQQTLAEQVTKACQQAIAGVYPFSRSSDKDMDIKTFQELFGPSGRIDRFYTANLAQFIDTSKATWTWNQANPVAQKMPASLARDFQRANDIRQAFFPQGAPTFSFVVQNLSLGDGIETARLDINSGVLSIDQPKPAAPAPFGGLFSSPTPPPPQAPALPQIVTFQWPGPVGLSSASLTLLPAIPGRAQPPAKTGPWAVFRLLDTANMSRSGEALTVRFNVTGREAVYRINVNTLPNPFTLTALREFRCPTAQ